MRHDPVKRCVGTFCFHRVLWFGYYRAPIPRSPRFGQDRLTLEAVSWTGQACLAWQWGSPLPRYQLDFKLTLVGRYRGAFPAIIIASEPTCDSSSPCLYYYVLTRPYSTKSVFISVFPLFSLQSLIVTPCCHAWPLFPVRANFYHQPIPAWQKTSEQRVLHNFLLLTTPKTGTSHKPEGCQLCVKVPVTRRECEWCSSLNSC